MNTYGSTGTVRREIDVHTHIPQESDACLRLLQNGRTLRGVILRYVPGIEYEPIDALFNALAANKYVRRLSIIYAADSGGMPRTSSSLLTSVLSHNTSIRTLTIIRLPTVCIPGLLELLQANTGIESLHMPGVRWGEQSNIDRFLEVMQDNTSIKYLDARGDPGPKDWLPAVGPGEQVWNLAQLIRRNSNLTYLMGCGYSRLYTRRRKVKTAILEAMRDVPRKEPLVLELTGDCDDFQLVEKFQLTLRENLKDSLQLTRAMWEWTQRTDKMLTVATAFIPRPGDTGPKSLMSTSVLAERRSFRSAFFVLCSRLPATVTPFKYRSFLFYPNVCSPF